MEFNWDCGKSKLKKIIIPFKIIRKKLRINCEKGNIYVNLIY